MKRIVLVLAFLLLFQIAYADIICTETESNEDRNNTVFETNILNLFFNFAIQIQNSSLKFYNDTIGKEPNKVYGLYQCRNDVDIDVCNTCIDDAREITTECPPSATSGEAIGYYANCIVRYASRNIFSLCETNPSFRESNMANIENYEVFAPILNRTMKELIKNASSDLPYFAMAKTTWISNHTIYSYAQCTPDVNVTECFSCLDTAREDMMNCCSEHIGAKIFQPSCQLRYESESFLSDPAFASPGSLIPVHSPPSGGSKEPSLRPAILGAITSAALIALVV